MKDDIRLPPLPKGDLVDARDGYFGYTAEQARDIQKAAIKAGRQKRRRVPNEPFAIVIDRMYEGEGPSLAYWNGENYRFSDGDCYNREGDTLDGCTAEFLTDHQLEKRLLDDHKRKSEPEGWALVPKEPVWDMEMAGIKKLIQCTDGELECIHENLLDEHISEVREIFSAMLKAAPKFGEE